MTRTLRTLLLLLALLGLAAPAWGAPGDAAPDFGDDDDDDDDDDAPVDEEEVEEETEEVLEEAEEALEDAEEEVEEAAEEDDYDPLDGLDLPGEEAAEEQPAATESAAVEEEEDDTVAPVEEEKKSRRDRKNSRVKVIQKKFFLKYRRLELTPNVGYVGNYKFITRLQVGLMATYHINDILGIEVMLGYMPDLGDTDYKPLTKRFQQESEVVPDISRVVFTAGLAGTVSPIYGKIELGTDRIINYDLYFLGGAGMVSTKDDTAIINSPCENLATRRERKNLSDSVVNENGCYLVDQEHFASYFGGGLRIVFNKWIGIRLDVRNITHIEQAWRSGDRGLEMKQTLLINFGLSMFIPPEPRRFN